MGGNQVKAVTHHSSPLLNVESVALTCQDDQERRFLKKLPRRLGPMLLADWVPHKRRENEVVEKAHAVVNEGRAPPELLKEVEMFMKSATYKPRIKYHPKFKPKPRKPRLKGPRLTQTAARRIQESYERRERQQQQEERAVQKRERSRLSVRSHGWTEELSRRSSKKTAASKLKQQEQRASSLPPSSTLSLQSITTAESSGIGMSRASSLSSVSSTKHRKTFFTRQRAQSVDADSTGGERLQTAQQRGNKQQSPQPEKRVSPSGRSPTTTSVTEGKQKWKVALRRSFQQVMQQRVRRQTGLSSSQGTKEQRMTRTKDSAKPPLIHPLNVEVKQAVPKIQREAMKKQLELQREGEARSEQQSSPSSQGEDPLKEKKEQGSQTRLSGPSRPRRLLLLRPGKNKVKQEEAQQQEVPDQQTSGCGSFQNKINSKDKWKRLLRMNKKDSKNNQQRERTSSLSRSQDQGRAHSLKSSPAAPRRSSTDATVDHDNGQRRLSQPAGGLQNQEDQENINAVDLHQTGGGERIIKVSRHQTPIDGCEYGQQQPLQGSASYEVDTQQYHRSSNRHQLAEEQLHQSQLETVTIVTAEGGYSETVLGHGGSRRVSCERGMIESDIQQARITELPIQGDEETAGWTDVNAEGRRASLVRNPNTEEQITVRPLEIVDHSRIVEAQGSRRPESFAGRRQEVSRDRGRMSAISLDHGILQAPVDPRLVTERVSPERMRHHASMERIQRDPAMENNRHEHPAEVLHGEAPVRATERIHRGSIVERPLRDSSTERLHMNSLHHDSLVEYPRVEGPVDRVRPDVAGRGTGMMERSGDRILPKVTHERAYLPARLDRGYSYEDERRGRQYQERRYTVGTIEPSYLGGYSDRHMYGRMSEPETTRIYSGRIAYSRALDSEPVRSRSIDHELARTYSYSESDYPSRVMDHEQAKIYAERLVAGGRLRGIEEYDVRDRGGRYRDAVVAQHSIASAPLVDHRSL